MEHLKAPEDSQAETVTKKDAMQFPLIGSAVLFGLYLVVKFVKKEYLDILISVYFSLLGSFSIFSCAQAPLTEVLGVGGLHRYKFSFRWRFWLKKEDDEPIDFSLSVFDFGLFLMCASFSTAYGVTKLWWLNNILGSAFSIQGIEMLSLGSYAIGCLLLSGLFFYDIFWVFGTEVMVSVAKGLNAPVKILFPKALGVKPMPMSMLGLGDIVIPGIFVALMLQIDFKKQLDSKPYFYSNFVSYVLGLVVTVSIMHFFESAQPALLYLVPACIGSSVLCALQRGELKEILNYSSQKKEVSTEKKSE